MVENRTSRLAIGTALFVLAAGPDAARAADWPFYRLELIGTSNVAEPLTAAQGATLAPNWVAYTNGYNYSNPIVASGTVYLTSGDGALYAYDALNGALRWRRYSTATGPFHCLAPTQKTKGPVGAPAVLGSTVFMPGADGVIYAYDAATGATRWQTPIANVADKGEFLWSSIFPLRNKLYIGVSSLHDCLLVPGRVVALDQISGAVVGTWWADAQQRPGGGVWTQPAYDARTNRLFFTTGTIAAGLTPAQQPYADAFVAVDPDTLQTLDHHTIPGTFADDIDFGASPTLFDTPAGRHMIVAANKNGIVYALDRDNLAAGPVWTYRVADFSLSSSPDLGDTTIVSAPFASGTIFVGGGRTSVGVPPGGTPWPGSVAALDAATGAEKWLIHPAGFVLAAMTTVGDLLLFGATDATTYAGTFYAVSQATGQVIYTRPTGGLFGQPTYSNGVVYVPDLKGALHALAAPGVGPAPDWSVSIWPQSQGLGAGTSVVYTVTTSSLQPLSLSVSGLPAGVTAALSSTTATPGPTPTNGVKLTLSLPAGSPGGRTATFTVTGAPASGTSRSARANVVPVASDFSLGAEKPAPLPAGRSVAISVGTLPVGPGAPEAIALSFEGPAGLTGSFSPATVMAGGSSTLTVTAAPDLGDATQTVSVIGTAPSAAHRAALDVKVLARPTPKLSSPASGARVSGVVQVVAAATVSADTSLASLSLAVDGSRIASSASSPATFSWDTTRTSAGIHSLEVTATDAAGNSATSAAVQVSVQQDAPPKVSPSPPEAPARGCASAGDAGIAQAIAALAALLPGLRAQRSRRDPRSTRR
jgi:outer membrane protein assembly factor BamB